METNSANSVYHPRQWATTEGDRRSINQPNGSRSAEEDLFDPELPPSDAVVDSPDGSPGNDEGVDDQRFESFLRQEAANPAFAVCVYHDDREDNQPETELEGRSIQADEQTEMSDITALSTASLFRGPLYQTPIEMDVQDEDVANLFNGSPATESDRQPKRTSLRKPLPTLTEAEEQNVPQSEQEHKAFIKGSQPSAVSDPPQDSSAYTASTHSASMTVPPGSDKETTNHETPEAAPQRFLGDIEAGIHPVSIGGTREDNEPKIFDGSMGRPGIEESNKSSNRVALEGTPEEDPAAGEFLHEKVLDKGIDTPLLPRWKNDQHKTMSKATMNKMGNNSKSPAIATATSREDEATDSSGRRDMTPPSASSPRRETNSESGSRPTTTEASSGESMTQLVQSFIGSIAELPPPNLAGSNGLGAPTDEPGAYALSGSAYRDDDPPQIHPSRRTNPPHLSTDVLLEGGAGLAEARPVDENDIVAAEEYNHSKRNQHLQTNRLVMGFILVFIVAIAIIISLALLKEHKNDSQSEPESTMPTTASPPVVMSSEDWILSLLPEHSVANILKEEAFGQTMTAQYQAFRWVLNDPFVKDYSAERILQRFSLAALYYSTQGDNWYNNTNWLSYHVHECDWWFSRDQPVLTLNEDTFELFAEPNVPYPCQNATLFNAESRTYQKLWLNANNLNGELPGEISLLQSLTGISLETNDLKSTIPSTIGDLSALEYSLLATNKLTGPVPSEFGLLTTLEMLTLFYNALTGTVPSTIGNMQSLEWLIMDSNKFRGPIPSELGLLSSSMKIALDGNSLTGPIPSELGLLPSSMMWLADNSLTGTIPSELAQMSNLTSIWVHANLLSGHLPTELGMLPQLEELWAQRNVLTGPIPSELGKLSSVVDLILRENKFSGQIPTEIGNANNLTRCWLTDNYLTGWIPSEFGKLSQLTAHNLYNNMLSGSIPSELWVMPNVRVFQLNGNSLEGRIPTEIGNAKQMRSLWLFNTTLTGVLPTEIGMLSNLKRLFLGRSSFSGPIPSEFGQISSLQRFFLENSPAITGNLPSELGLLSNLLWLSIEGNNLSGAVPEELELLATNGSLISMNVSRNTLLSGSVPDSICLIGTRMDDVCPTSGLKSAEACGLAFDCSDHLCGCDCPCMNHTS